MSLCVNTPGLTHNFPPDGEFLAPRSPTRAPAPLLDCQAECTLRGPLACCWHDGMRAPPVLSSTAETCSPPTTRPPSARREADRHARTWRPGGEPIKMAAARGLTATALGRATLAPCTSASCAEEDTRFYIFYRFKCLLICIHFS